MMSMSHFLHQLLLPSILLFSVCDLISKEKIVMNDTNILDHTPILDTTIPKNIVALKDAYIHALASLIFYLHQEEKTLEERSHFFGTIDFTDADVSNLWDKVNKGISHYSRKKEKQSEIIKARELYIIANREVQDGLISKALTSLEKAEDILKRLLEKAIEDEEGPINENIDLQTIQQLKDFNVKNYSHIPKKSRQAMKPYLLPLTHPMRNTLDDIFRNYRVTENEALFSHAGFQTIATGNRSYIVVATHEKLQGYLVKAYLDNELNKKHGRESWEWLVRRCQGAKQIRDIIKRRSIKYFVVSDKWLYCLPPEPTPLSNPLFNRHFAILLVTDMQLAPRRRNYNAWFNEITTEHLDELYLIITRAKGSSYRPDNIAYTKNNQFAFIDTEYPTKGPDYLSIRHYLNPEMCDYWDKLVINGGF